MGRSDLPTHPVGLKQMLEDKIQGSNGHVREGLLQVPGAHETPEEWAHGLVVVEETKLVTHYIILF